MSEDKANDGVKITRTDQPRVKDPKRVEAGKRLGAISKAAKEKKARERYDREAALARENEVDTHGMDWTGPIGAGVGVVGLIGLCYVFFKRDSAPQGRWASPPAGTAHLNGDPKGNLKVEPTRSSPSGPEPSARGRRDPTPKFDPVP